MERHENVGHWMAGNGPECDVVISSRVRLARNVAGHRFTSRASLEERSELAARLSEAVKRLGFGPSIQYLDLTELSEIDRVLLVERHLISREHAEGEGPRGVAFSHDETISVMVNEEDHLRMQVLHDGFDLDEIRFESRPSGSRRIAANTQPKFGQLP